MVTSFYTMDEISKLGFNHYGENLLISRNANFYGIENISLGSNIRIDDFCILSGKINIGNFVHIAAFTALYGGIEGIKLSDFSNLSSRVTIYSVSDDYSGETLTNPMVPNKYKNTQNKQVFIGKHVIIGATSVVLPGVELKEGSAFGAFSFINTSTEPWCVYAGIPIQKISSRKKNLLKLEKKFLKSQTGRKGN